MFLSNSTQYVLEKIIVLEMALYKSNQELVEDLNKVESNTIICPSPIIADKLRSLIPRKNVITISKWISDNLAIASQKKIKKADLLIKLASIWQKFNKDGTYSQFKSHFDIFTELRSYSLDLGLLNDVLADYDEELKKTVYLFWASLDAENIIDEQLAYKMIGESDVVGSIVFVGFKFLNGVQIDMLKNLSQSNEVRVYLPQQLENQLFDSDWPTWLVPKDEFRSIGIDSQGDENLPSLPRVIFPKGKSSEIVDIYSKKFSRNTLVLGASKITYHQVQEIAQDNHFYKISIDVFFEELQKLIEDITIDIKNGTFNHLDQLELWLINRGEHNQKKSNYLGLKIVQLAKVCIEMFKQYNSDVSVFLSDLIREIVQLNAPRIFRVSLKREDSFEVLGLDDLIFRQEFNPITLLVNSEFGGLSFSEKKMSEALLRAIRAIAPIRRMGLEYSFLKVEIQHALNMKGSILLIDSETVEYDYSWNEALKNFKFIDVNETLKFKKKEFKKILPLKNITNNSLTYTASKLQNYLDCPQKYYYTYVEPLEHSPSEKNFLSTSELGQIEHKIIEKYFWEITNYEFDEKRHYVIVKEVFHDFLCLKNISLSAHLKVSAESEVMNLSQNGIIFLLELIKNSDFKKIQFELNIPANELAIKGSIDCLITLKNEEVILIDLKRSSSAIGSKNDTDRFKKIQIWAYALCLHKAGGSIHSMGYLCLKDPDKKSLFIKNEDIAVRFKNRIEIIEKIILDIIEQLSSDNQFNPMPKDKAVCMHCHVQLVCTKGLE